MKKNRSTPILAIILVAVWGVAGFKIWSGFTRQRINTRVVPRKVQSVNTVDTLLLNYRNPFVQIHTRQPVKTAQPLSRRVGLIPEKRVLPDFQFKGTLRGYNGHFLLIQHSGNHTLVRPDEMIGEFRIVKVFEDSIRVRRKNDFFTIVKL